jgi:hypothetical protein
MTRLEAIGYLAGFVLRSTGVLVPSYLTAPARPDGLVTIDVWFFDVTYDKQGRVRRKARKQVARFVAQPGREYVEVLDESRLFDWKEDRRSSGGEFLTKMTAVRRGYVTGNRMKVRGQALFFRNLGFELPNGIFHDTVPAQGASLEVEEIYWGG